MLENNFYTTISFAAENNGAKSRVKLNRQHPVFIGHFPEVPVVPGVCSVQMIQELAEKAVSAKLMLSNGDNIKFLGVINPDENPELDIELTYKTDDKGEIAASASISGNGTVFLKFKGQFKC
jgi:3-hydroxyacyl-[acyl-carrier-protein] dehydratase